MTRIDQMKADGISPPIPPDPLPYLTAWLFEIGPTVPSGMGPVGLGWRDLTAWQDISGIELMPWEARLLRRLSGEFVGESSRAEKPDCPAPWATPEMDAQSREAVSRKVANALEALMK